MKYHIKQTVLISFALLTTIFSTVASSNKMASSLVPMYNLLLLDDGAPSSKIYTCSANLIKDINPGGLHSQLSENPQFTQVGNQVFFRAETAANGLELWVTDGSTAGTHLVKDIDPGTRDSVSGNANAMFTAVGNKLMFVAESPSLGRELWKSDGTPSGTQLVKELTAGVSYSTHSARVALNNKLYFLGQGESNVEAEGLWVSNGTSTGTSLIKDTHPFNNNVGGSEKMAVLDNKLIFRADGEVGRQEPWISNLTSAGTSLLKDIAQGSAYSQADGFTTIGNKVFFFANGGGYGMELWVTNGSTAGTFMVKNINGSGSGVGSNNFSFTSTHFLNLNGQAVFVADDGVHGKELWISDGTAGGTRMIKDIAPGSEDSRSDWRLDNAAVLNGKLYFQADDNQPNSSNRELWVTDGTAAGTRLFADLKSNGSSAPESIFSANDLIMLSADGDSNFGTELWILNESGARREININPNGSSSPEYLFDFNGQTLFFARTAQHGNELWGLNCD